MLRSRERVTRCTTQQTVFFRFESPTRSVGTDALDVRDRAYRPNVRMVNPGHPA